MTRYGRRLRVVAAVLAAQAGFIDALGFLKLGGFFVSFMSGNSTRAAVEVTRSLDAASTAAALIGLFVAGVMAGSLVRRAGRRPLTIVQGFVVLVLAAAASAHRAGHDPLAIALMTFAMGAENAAFERDDGPSIGLTYVTGALVKTGQLLVGIWFGRGATEWVWPALLWLGLVAGGVLGAVAYDRLGLDALALVAGVGVIVTFVAHAIERRVPDARHRAGHVG